MTAPYVDPNGSPGKAIGLVEGVAKPGTRYVTGFGAKTLGGVIPPDAQSSFELASVTKVYTGYLLARGIAHQEVELTDVPEDTFGPNVPTYNGESIDTLGHPKRVARCRAMRADRRPCLGHRRAARGQRRASVHRGRSAAFLRGRDLGH